MTVTRRLVALVVLSTCVLTLSDAVAQRSRQRPVVELAVLRADGEDADRSRRSLRALAAKVARRTSVEMTTTEPPVLGASDPKLFDHPLVFLAGSDDFGGWNEADSDALRTYLTSGGMIVLDDASGKGDSAFRERARAELSRILGGREFTPLEDDHALFRSYYLLQRPWGRVDVSDVLQGLVLDGRVAVIDSRNDLLGALERDALGGWARPVHPGGREQRERALRLGVNLVLYALTLDYKEDLVHLPLILERRR
ncbi:MAG: DUF4159 domain-containing protein [Acidobacteriota bacterium]